jgi:hypothetical protein
MTDEYLKNFPSGQKKYNGLNHSIDLSEHDVKPVVSVNNMLNNNYTFFTNFIKTIRQFFSKSTEAGIAFLCALYNFLVSKFTTN